MVKRYFDEQQLDSYSQIVSSVFEKASLAVVNISEVIHRIAQTT